MPIKNAMAIIVLPPLNRNPETKQRPQAADLSSLPDNSPAPQNFTRPPLPLCTLHPTLDEQPLPEDIPQSTSRVPLYNAVPLFPNPDQRATLLSLLKRICLLEQRQRAAHADFGISEKLPKDDSQRSSHAFVLMSNEDITLTADMAAVGLALWRLPMFEGMGWEGKTDWVKRYKYRSMHGNEKYEIA